MSHVNGCLVGCVLRPIDSEVIQRQQPHLLSLAKDVNLNFYTVPIGNRTLGHCFAVHYTTAVPRFWIMIILLRVNRILDTLQRSYTFMILLILFHFKGNCMAKSLIISSNMALGPGHSLQNFGSFH